MGSSGADRVTAKDEKRLDGRRVGTIARLVIALLLIELARREESRRRANMSLLALNGASCRPEPILVITAVSNEVSFQKLRI